MNDKVSKAAKGGGSQRVIAALRRPLVRTTLIAVTIVVAGWLAFNFASSRPLTVEVATIRRDVPVRVFGLGTVEARILSKVGFEVGATLVELDADHGDLVKKGQILARLATGEQEAKVAKARAALVIAEVNVDKAAANIAKVEAVLAQRQAANSRKQSLVGRNVVSQESAEEASRDEAVAKADVIVASSEAETAKAQLADAKAQLEFEQTMLRHRTLIAPYDGLVIERHKEAGAVIKAGDPIFTLMEHDSQWGLAYIDEARAGFVAEGQKADIRLRSRPLESFAGEVVRVGLESDRVSEERRVFIRGDIPTSKLHLGEQAEFWIRVAEIDQALLVPEAAVHGYDGRKGVVWTVEQGQLRKRSVGFRHRTEDSQLEIVSGLPEGASVVVKVADNFREGRAARGVAAPADAGREAAGVRK